MWPDPVELPALAVGRRGSDPSESPRALLTKVRKAVLVESYRSLIALLESTKCFSKTFLACRQAYSIAMARKIPASKQIGVKVEMVLGSAFKSTKVKQYAPTMPVMYSKAWLQRVSPGSKEHKVVLHYESSCQLQVQPNE